MTGQAQKEYAHTRPATDTDQTETPGGEARSRAAALSAETDDLLDEIDELLAEMPEDFAATYRQAGGQ